MTSLIENGTWSLTPLPAGKKVIDNKWVFKVKKDEDGNYPLRNKARLVIKGGNQKKGLDYKKTYAAVAKISVRILLSIINYKYNY